MDAAQIDRVVETHRIVTNIEGSCRNLKFRLTEAVGELKGEPTWKPVAVAAAVLYKQVDVVFNEILKTLAACNEKKRVTMSLAEYKKKSEKMYKLIASTSDTAALYWVAYKKSFDTNAKIGACSSAKASYGYVADLMKHATDAKIGANRIK